MSSLACDEEGEENLGDCEVIPPGDWVEHVARYVTLNSRHAKGYPSFKWKTCFLKPFQKNISLAQKEVAFYKKIWSTAYPTPSFFPKFFGICSRDQTGCRFIKLQDIEAPFLNPCSIDIKLGTRTYDEEASIEKISREKLKFPYQESVGYRIIGMKVYDKKSGQYRLFDKSYGLSFNDKNIPHALLNFIFDGEFFRFDVLEKIIEKLLAIEKWFSEKSPYRFYGHSVLIVYESDGCCNSDSVNMDQDVRPLPREHSCVDVKLIDFAHWYESEGASIKRDESSIKGIKSLLRSFQWVESLVKSRAYTENT